MIEDTLFLSPATPHAPASQASPLSLTTAPPQRWFPRLIAGYLHPAAAQAETLASVAWLVMTEMHAYLEDLEGAVDTPDVVDVLRVKLAELLADLDCRLSGSSTQDELHQLPLLLEYGLTQVAYSSGEDVAHWMGFGARSAPSQPAGARSNSFDASDARRLIDVFTAMLSTFPGTLFNPLLPGTQGQVLRTLRAWDKMCRLAGRDAAFLIPLMKSL